MADLLLVAVALQALQILAAARVEALAGTGLEQQVALASLSSRIARPLAEYCPSKAPANGLAQQV
jgi:hypothetical protein